jgi:arsenite-transporting ATPase
VGKTSNLNPQTLIPSNPQTLNPACALPSRWFRRIISGLSGGDDKGNSIADKLGLGGLTDIFDNPPPGADELVALSKVVSLVEEGEAKTAMGEPIKFDRVVIDTAPTGHTMRLLDYPGFIESLLTKALNLRGE